MNLQNEFVENLPAPKCSYCGKTMYANHRKTWMGMKWHYLAIEFRCDVSEIYAPHSFSITARNIKEWERHERKIKFTDDDVKS